MTQNASRLRPSAGLHLRADPVTYFKEVNHESRDRDHQRWQSVPDRSALSVKVFNGDRAMNVDFDIVSLDGEMYLAKHVLEMARTGEEAGSGTGPTGPRGQTEFQVNLKLGLTPATIVTWPARWGSADAHTKGA